jgi:hypothetical protein
MPAHPPTIYPHLFQGKQHATCLVPTYLPKNACRIRHLSPKRLPSPAPRVSGGRRTITCIAYMATVWMPTLEACMPSLPAESTAEAFPRCDVVRRNTTSCVPLTYTLCGYCSTLQQEGRSAVHFSVDAVVCDAMHRVRDSTQLSRFTKVPAAPAPVRRTPKPGAQGTSRNQNLAAS